MSDHNYDNDSHIPHDEYDIVITHLHTTDEKEHAHDSSSVPTYISLRSHLTARQRFWRLTATTTIILVVVILMLNSNPATRAIVSGWLPRPASSSLPPSTGDIDTNNFAIYADPSWGQISVDGYTEDHFLTNTIDHPFHLLNGPHTLIWKIDPFQPRKCIISVPVHKTDTCQYSSAYFPDKKSLQIITFYQSLKTLPMSQQQSLVEAVQTTLDKRISTDTVQTGELFLHVKNGSSVFEQATQPLKATYHLLLDTDTTVPLNSSCTPPRSTCLIPYGGSDQRQNCLLFCTVPHEYLPPIISTDWNVVVMVHMLWNYQTLSGHIVAKDQPDTRPIDTQFEYMLYLNILWDGTRWQVSLIPQSSSDNVACLSVNLAEGDIPYLYGSRIFGSQQGVGWNILQASGSNPSQGCLLSLQPEVDNSNPASPSNNSSTPIPVATKLPSAYCLYRFGVILAANNTAHQYWPDMPVADSYEKRLAQQWAAANQWNNGS